MHRQSQCILKSSDCSVEKLASPCRQNSRNRLVGEGLNPEKINIKAFLVSIDAELYHE